MYNAKLRNILNSSNYLLVNSTCFLFIKSFLRNNVIKKFSTLSILHNQIKSLFGLNNLVHLNNIRMSDYLQNMYFPCNSFDISDVLDFVFFQDFDSNLFIGLDMDAFLYLSEGSLSNGLPNDVLSDPLALLLVFGCVLHRVNFLPFGLGRNSTNKKRTSV